MQGPAEKYNQPGPVPSATQPFGLSRTQARDIKDDFIAELLRVDIYQCQRCLLCNDGSMSGATALPTSPRSQGKLSQKNCQLRMALNRHGWLCRHVSPHQGLYSLLPGKNLLSSCGWEAIVCIQSSFSLHPIYPFLVTSGLERPSSEHLL